MASEFVVRLMKELAVKNVIFCTFAKFIAKNEEPLAAPLFAIFAIASNMNLT